MLKNIRLHIEQNEEKQAALEAKLAEHITATRRDNINAFQRHIPSLLPYIKQTRSQNISLICNKYSRFNAVDYGLGRVLYGFDPENEVKQHVDEFCQHSPYVDFNCGEHGAGVKRETIQDDLSLASLPAYQRLSHYSSFPAQADLLVVLGLGLGYQIKELLLRSQVKHLIIYEPELQYFSCSIMVTAWREILDLAKQQGTSLYFQLEKDGRDLIQDISELRQHFDVSGFYLYQHYHNAVFNSIRSEIGQHSWTELNRKGLSFHLQESNDQYCPVWTAPISLSQYQLPDPANEKFKKNLQAFKRYFPAIHKEFKDYQAKSWQPIVQASSKHQGEVNIVKADSLVPWYSDSPKEDCFQNLNNYAQQPHKDGLVLGYKGEKLKNYLHYRFVKETESLLEELEEEQGELPDTIKSLIMFGLGTGYQLEKLVQDRTVEKLFICEPNRDFFYASLFAIDWEYILTTIDQNDGRIYINIGDDGSNLFRDLINQFYSIGPYILSHTYFYQSYYNASLNSAIAQLREQLQVVIAMGEYFDHAYYGIAHTKEAFQREIPHMRKGAASYLSYDDKEVPVFMVGNGPSLDYSIAAIKEWQGEAIIVSCGTALHTLHRNGITPDFHAEIEQNRSTFDWAARIGDFDYLKSITLISCNGIHPDTCDLYKDVLVAFKEGESSTVSTLKVVGDDNYETLKFAFPTVTNFAVNFFIKLDFKQVYLFGVDLGFADNTKHHSTQSGYYDAQGNPLYDYNEKNNTSLVVPGNFRKTVFTKQEFKIAKMIMEQSIASCQSAFYNTSDGAKIFGAQPLSIEALLITNTAQAKSDALASLKHQCCISIKQDEFNEKYDKQFSSEVLAKELSMFKKRIEQEVETLEDAELLVESQKKMLFASYGQSHSLLFYYLYGTVNYANVILSKLCQRGCDGVFLSSPFKKAQQIWGDNFAAINHMCKSRLSFYDISSSFTTSREQSFLLRLRVKELKIFSSNKAVNEIAVSYFKDKTVLSFPDSTNEIRENDTVYCFCENKEDIVSINNNLSNIESSGKKQIRVLVGFSFVPEEQVRKRLLSFKNVNVSLIINPGQIEYLNDRNEFVSGRYPFVAYGSHLMEAERHILDIEQFSLFIPKLVFSEANKDLARSYTRSVLSELSLDNEVVSFKRYLAVPRNIESTNKLNYWDSVGGLGNLKSEKVSVDDMIVDWVTYEQATHWAKIYCKENA